MNGDNRYVFPDNLRNAYERLLFPLAVYQFVGGKVVTLLVSDGMCEFMHVDRDALVNHYDENMFGNVHPDDCEMLASLGARFAVKEGPYDIVYRDRTSADDEYRYVHTIGKYHTMDDGSRVAFLTYADITQSVVSLVKAFEEESNPQARFLDENVTALIVVSPDSGRVLYSNAAAKRMLPPQAPYDSFITFQDYFYKDIPDAMPGLFDQVEAGPRRIIEPRTKRPIEVDVVESEWAGEKVFVARLYEVGETNDGKGNDSAADAAELHRRRIAFNAALFTGEGNGLAYWQRGYQGVRVWNLTANRMVTSSGDDYLQHRYGEGMTYDEYLARVAGNARNVADVLLETYNRDALLLGFENGIQPPEIIVELKSDKGVSDIKAHFTLLRSPESGEVFLRLTEHNVTDRELGEHLMEATVSHEFDFVSYIDIEGNLCRMVFGSTDNEQQRNFVTRLDEYCETLSGLMGRRFVTVDGLKRFIAESLDGTDDHVETFELEDGTAKSLRVSSIAGKRNIYYIRRSDVTSLIGGERERERELARAKLAADRANEAKSSFLSGMSHDIRTPLNGIIGFTDFALAEDDFSVARGYMEKVRSSADLLLGIVNDVLDLSRIESGKVALHPEPVSVGDIGAAVVESLRPTAEAKNIELIFDPCPDKMIFVDKLAYQKIWLNLVSNAIKYTPVGGTVEARVETLDPPIDGRNRRLVVADNGIGMTEEFQRIMFEPFSQESRAEATGVQGTGLGLSIVKRFVDLLGGTMRVKSTLGQGTRYEIDVNIQPLEEGALAEEKTSVSRASLAGSRMLLCEDNEMNAEITRMLLLQRGIECDWASDGRSGLRLFETSEPGRYDAVLMDVRMPGMDGRQATRAIRALDRADAQSVPIIALTADAFEEDILENREAGMDAHVTKPIVPDKLFQTIGNLLAHG